MIVADDEAEVEEAVTRLARVGLEHVQGISLAACMPGIRPVFP